MFTFVTACRYLVFCQAGDHSIIDMWLKQEKEKRNFDVIIGYYGDTELDPSFAVDYKYYKKGYKIPSLKYLHDTLLRGVLHSYDAVFALDSDIVITTEQLNEIFITRELYGLDMMGPSQSRQGKVSWKFLRPTEPYRKLRYVSIHYMHWR